MKEKPYFPITGIIFAIITILHLLRIIYSWPALIGTFKVPLWLSWVALIIGGYLAFISFSLFKKFK